MTENQDAAPQPAPPQPPQPSVQYYGQPPRMRRPLGALTVVIAVGCLASALCCGCLDGYLGMASAILQQGAAAEGIFADAMKDAMSSAKRSALAKADSDEERERILRAFDTLEREELPEVMTRTIRKGMESPSAATLTMLGFMACAAHVAMFVTGILLFLRRSIARWLGIVSCCVLIGLHAMIAFQLLDISSAMTGEFVPWLENMSRSSGHVVESDIGAISTQVRGATVMGIVGMLVLSSIWPVIAALTLGLSRRIAEDTSTLPQAHPQY